MKEDACWLRYKQWLLKKTYCSRTSFIDQPNSRARFNVQPNSRTRFIVQPKSRTLQLNSRTRFFVQPNSMTAVLVSVKVEDITQSPKNFFSYKKSVDDSLFMPSISQGRSFKNSRSGLRMSLSVMQYCRAVNCSCDLKSHLKIKIDLCCEQCCWAAL